MLGGPITAGMFTLGLRLGSDSSWVGLPFYTSSVSPTKHLVTEYCACSSVADRLGEKGNLRHFINPIASASSET